MIEHIISQMEEERGLDRAAAIADMRFDFIQKLVDETVVKPQESRGARAQPEDRPRTDRKIYGDPGVCRHYGTGIFPYV